MFVRKSKYEFLRGQYEGARLLIEHLERLVEYERRNRAEPHPTQRVADEVAAAPRAEVLALPPKVSAAVAQAAGRNADAKITLTEAAHAMLQEGIDPKEVVERIAVGERSFDSLLRIS
jgi:hypothetical protein